MTLIAQNVENAIAEQTALVIFAFNRPHAMGRLLASLHNCQEFTELPVYFFIDGARHAHETPAVQAVVDLANHLVHPQKVVVQRSQNIGLRSSIREGVSQVLEQHRSVIILEDDLIVGPHALDYFLCALTRYRNDGRVVSICGYALLDVTEASDAVDTARFLPMTHPWGWATWDDRWRPHRESWTRPLDAKQIAADSFRKAMNVFGQRDYSKMLIAAERGRITSWWIYWHLDAIRHHQISLFPAKTQIINAGIDGSGTHASRWNVLRGLFPSRRLANRAAHLPDFVEIDHSLLDQIRTSREARFLRLIGRLGALRRELMQLVKSRNKD